jgi:hypothetical protein
MDIRYIAGLVDGEGYITMRIQTHVDARHPTWAPQRRVILNLGINMTDPRGIREIHRRYGGFFKTRRRPAKPTHRPLHCWILCNQQAGALLKKLTPHLRVKREEALIALRFLEHLKARKPRGKDRGPTVTEDEWTFRQWCCDELHRLKHVVYD